MSWKAPGGFRPRSPRPGGSSGDTGSVFSGGSAGGPSLLVLIVAALAVGLVGLGLAVAFGGGTGQSTATTAPQPTARPTTPPAVLPTAAATAAAQPTTAAAQPTSAPTGGAAGIPTEPLGPAVASGSGTPVELGTDVALLIFNQEQITVPSGLVTLTFKNLAEAVQHNWVLVDGGDDVATAVNDAAQAQSRATRSAAGSVPPADTPGLLVAVPMLDPGGQVTVTFQTPPPGTYEYICTFPGHYVAGMRGKLIVQ